MNVGCCITNVSRCNRIVSHYIKSVSRCITNVSGRITNVSRYIANVGSHITNARNCNANVSRFALALWAIAAKGELVALYRSTSQRPNFSVNLEMVHLLASNDSLKMCSSTEGA